MALIQLKAISQSTLLGSDKGPSGPGVCYYMCNYIESKNGIWNKSKDINEARQKAQNFVNGTAMINYAKSKNIQHSPYRNYLPIATPGFRANSLYRVRLELTETATGRLIGTHECILLTGAHNEVIFFDPNFGFYEVQPTTANNVAEFENDLEQFLYLPTYNTGNFSYSQIRSIQKELPKGFDE